MRKKAVVLGAGGFIGGHLVNRLKREGYYVKGADLKKNEFGNNYADDFERGDLRNAAFCESVLAGGYDEVYQLAADMGGAGYIFTGEHDADVMRNSVLCNVNALEACKIHHIPKIFYSSSACIYPEYNQMDPDNPKCSEESAYPAAPDSEYGWEKLFSERLYLSYQRNYGIDVRIARFHNIFGPQGTWTGGKEKAPSAMCRKVAEAKDGTHIDVWGDGMQTRSFLYIEECLEAVRRLMNSNFTGPVNVGSEEMISINEFAKLVIGISGKNLSIRNIKGPTGVRGRNSDNHLLKEKIGWTPSLPLRSGMIETYNWIKKQVSEKTVRPVTA
jgi:GDP-D-mannose 3', 5'-epimerase